MVLLLVSVQCRAKCVAVPHQTTQKAPECPLHKSKAPVSQQCTHAPQWDFDDVQQFVATVEAPAALMLEYVGLSTPVASVPLIAAPIPPPLILRI